MTIEPIRDPWGDFEVDCDFGGDALYAGDHEVIEDLVMLTETCLDFEYWCDDFRYWDRVASGRKQQDWEQRSAFSETTSIKLSKQEARDR